MRQLSTLPATGGSHRQPAARHTQPALEQRFVALVFATADRLGLEIAPAALSSLRIVSTRQAPSQKDLEALGLDAKSARFCRAQAHNGDSSFWPQAGLVLLRHSSRVHLAEEAAHVMRHVLTPLRVPQNPVDAFYMRAVEEGLAFFASKLLCPKRPAPSWHGAAQATGRGHLACVMRVAHAHVAAERGESTPVALYPHAARVTDAVTHLLGYRLGDALYRAFDAQLCDARKVRALFLRTTGGPGEACMLYWQLALALRDFLLPSGARYDAAATLSYAPSSRHGQRSPRNHVAKGLKSR